MDMPEAAARLYFQQRDRAADRLGETQGRFEAEQWQPGKAMALEGAHFVDLGTPPKPCVMLIKGRHELRPGDWIVVAAGIVSVFDDETFQRRFVKA